jgi:hypothetical protein
VVVCLGFMVHSDVKLGVLVCAGWGSDSEHSPPSLRVDSQPYNSDKGAVIRAFGCPGGSGEYLQMPGHL